MSSGLRLVSCLRTASESAASRRAEVVNALRAILEAIV